MGELYYKKSDIDAIFEKAISKYDYRNMAVLDAIYEIKDDINSLKNYGDKIARQILADLTNSSANDTTNTLAKRIIFGDNKDPLNKWMYQNLNDFTDDDLK